MYTQKKFPTAFNLIYITHGLSVSAKWAHSLILLELKRISFSFFFSVKRETHIYLQKSQFYRNAFFAYAATGWTRHSHGPGATTSLSTFVFFLERYLSTAAAASLPSAIAQTTSDCPRLQSPAANTPSTLVAKFPNWALKFDRLSCSKPSFLAISCS